MVHATTLFTNALIERKGAPTGLITTEGFRDTLEMRREHKYELYDLFIELPSRSSARRLRLEVPERIGADGERRTAARRGRGRSAQPRALMTQGVESLAVVFLHAYANPAHERRARELIAREFPQLFVSLSSRSRRRRSASTSARSTTVVNAYIKPLAESYLDSSMARDRGARHHARRSS